MDGPIGNALSLLGVALLWGVTNPFIKKGSAGIEDVKGKGAIRQFLAEIRYLIFNWKYMVPFLLNQSGSVLFYLTLGSADLSLAVPITNSLTFIMTTLTGRILGEESCKTETYIGMLLVVGGVSLCVMDKT
ncbi:transmembrane protein 234 homolog isoform X1 [Nematostella vectensis]|uniref:transmembrane protein 234 homolog isoform X1 n=1 Tax=Nematostella vectensis TaxID=45351 RepID=UPI0013904687|nr:transmembrane protein 234 homolog isoform X1 [Nematostella vectensis]